MPKFYAVKIGRNPGIYTDWPTCEAQVKGFSGAKYASFKTEPEARSFIEGTVCPTPETKPVQPEPSQNTDPYHIDIFVDESYNDAAKTCGYGILMDDGINKRILYGQEPCLYDGRNIEGELHASKIALQLVFLEKKYTSCTVYHDYLGIGAWADHEWKTNKPYTFEYQTFIDTLRKGGLSIEFKHVKGHTGVDGNEYVDKLAKIGCGIPLTKSEKKLLSNLKDVPGYPEETVERSL